MRAGVQIRVRPGRTRGALRGSFPLAGRRRRDRASIGCSPPRPPRAPDRGGAPAEAATPAAGGS